jgi:hypothetical protein
MHAATCHQALGASAPRAFGTTSRYVSAPGSTPRVPAVVPSRRLLSAAVLHRISVVAQARGGGGAGTAGKPTRGAKSTRPPGKPKPVDGAKPAKQGGGAFSRATKTVKQVGTTPCCSSLSRLCPAALFAFFDINRFHSNISKVLLRFFEMSRDSPSPPSPKTFTTAAGMGRRDVRNAGGETGKSAGQETEFGFIHRR